MYIRRFRYIALICLMILITSFAPLANGENKVVIHWSDIKAVIDQHPALQVAQSQVDQAYADVRISRHYPNPEAGVSYGRAGGLETDESATVYGLELGIPILSPGTIVYENKAAKSELKAVRNEALALRLQVVKQLKGLFIKATIGQEMVSSLSRSRDQLAHLVTVAGLRVKHGEARPMELTRLEIELEKTEADLAAAKQSLKSSLRSLNIYLGGKLPKGYAVQMAWTKLPTIPSIEVALERFEKSHPELQAALDRITAADAVVSAEYHNLVPELSVGGFYEREMDAQSYGGMLTVEVPIWNWNLGSIAKARAGRFAAKHRSILIQRELADAVEQAHAMAKQAMDRARRYRDKILPKAEETALANERLYQVGQTDIMDLIDARRSLIEIESEMQNAFLEGWMAYLNLTALIGEDDA